METRVDTQPSDAGVGRLKTIFVLLVLGAIAYVAIKTIPVYVNSYEVQDYIRQLAIKASVERVKPEAIQDQVTAHAVEKDLPVTRDNVNVRINGSKVRIDMDYTVPVDLRVYTLSLHFTPSSEDVI
jgi:cell division protein FtsL